MDLDQQQLIMQQMKMRASSSAQSSLDPAVERVRRALEKKRGIPNADPLPPSSLPSTSTSTSVSPPIMHGGDHRLPRGDGREFDPNADAAMAGFSGAQYRIKLMRSVRQLYGQSKILTDLEAKTLVIGLQWYETAESTSSTSNMNDDELLLITLTCVSNLAAFSSNQDLLRECGCIQELHRLLVNCAGGRSRMTSPQRIMLIQAVGNMAVNVNNHKVLQVCGRTPAVLLLRRASARCARACATRSRRTWSASCARRR